MPLTQKRLHKYWRDPENLPKRKITDRSIAIIAAIERYRFLPSSFILRLVEGNTRITYRHLQSLYHNSLINRFVFPRVGNPGEFIYYLDNPRALALLINYGFDRESLDFELVRLNKEKVYSEINFGNPIDDMQGRLMHLHHELMISRFHFMLGMSCRLSKSKIELYEWKQGSVLWHSVEAPKISYDANYNWREHDQLERLPHRPDAFFTLHFPHEPEGKQLSNFFYEADRKTTSIKKHNRKLRAHFHYIVKQKKHIEDYGIKRIRAVLIESTNMFWADELRSGAKHAVVSGNAPSPLFWFTTSELFTKPQEIEENRRKKTVPLYLLRPDMVLKKVWASPVDDTLYSLFD